MTIPNRVRLQRRAAPVLLAIALCAAAVMNNAQAASCPTENFVDFVKTFEDRAEIRQAYVHKPLTMQHVVVEGDQASVRSRKVADPAAELETLFALQKSKGLKVDVERPDRVTLRDGNGEYLIILLFEQKDCWKLSRIEDWSLGQQLSTARASDPATVALQRGVIYSRLAGETPSNSLIALYASALDSYLYGASMGSAKAAYAAAGLSLSGQAPRLPNERILSLLEMAAKSEAEAGITLAYFYCDAGEYGTNRPCANPEKALQALKDIARLDPNAALIELGNAYASGDVAAQDPSHALACYLEAQAKGATGLDRVIAGLKAKGATAQNSIHCL